MMIKRIDPDTLPQLPKNMFRCPICNAEVYISEIDEWNSDTGEVENLCVECVTEPDIDSDEWEDWFNGHYSMPYVDWLPFVEKVKKWLNYNYRMDVHCRGFSQER